MKTRKKDRNAFTLIELMVVVGIIAILAAVAIPAFDEYMKTAKTSEAVIILESIVTAQSAYYYKGRPHYPENSSEFHGLLPSSSNMTLDNGWHPFKSVADLQANAPGVWNRAGIAIPAGFVTLGVAPEGVIRYSYALTAPFTCGIYIHQVLASAAGDLDKDGQIQRFNRQIIEQGTNCAAIPFVPGNTLVIAPLTATQED